MDEFKQWLDDVGRQNAATLLGVTNSAIGHWLSGRRTMRPSMAQKVQQISMGRVKAADLVFTKVA